MPIEEAQALLTPKREKLGIGFSGGRPLIYGEQV